MVKPSFTMYVRSRGNWHLEVCEPGEPLFVVGRVIRGVEVGRSEAWSGRKNGENFCVSVKGKRTRA